MSFLTFCWQITQLVASGILSIKIAAQGATFDPEISIQALYSMSLGQ